MKPVSITKHVHDLTQPIIADGVKGLGQISKSGIEADILFFTVLLQLSCSKYNAYHSTALIETSLTLWQQVLLEMLIKLVQQNPGQDFICNWKQGDACVAITSPHGSFLFVEVNNQIIFKFL